MQVILLEKIHNLGSLGDKVNIKSGYGRNFLIPQGKAVSATPDNIGKFELRRAALEKAAQESLKQAQARAEDLEKIGVLTIAVKAGDEGKLFGSVGARDVADALRAQGAEVEKKEIMMPQSIRMVGEHEIFIQIHSDVRVAMKVNIVPSE